MEAYPKTSDPINNSDRYQRLSEVLEQQKVLQFSISL